jgi:DNA-binding HxlR family transcriptional regulator
MASDATASIEGEVRAGSRVLGIFENPLNARVLRAHVQGPRRLAELQEMIGRPAQTTTRAAVAGLCQIGALNRRAVGDSSYAVATELSAAGEEMLFVADEVEAWLALSPHGPIPPGGEEAKDAIKALAGGWSSTLMRSLAGRPFTVTQLAALIPGVSHAALERRVASMRASGQIEPVAKEGRGTPYVVTDWLRYAIAPLCAAGRWERRHLGEESPAITAVEVEASFLLALPLAPLSPQEQGTCLLAAQTDPVEPHARDRRLAGVSVAVKGGRVVSSAAEIDAEPSTWAAGTPAAWFEMVIGGRIDDLRIGGSNPQLALNLVSGMHYALFGHRADELHQKTRVTRLVS